MRTSFPRLLFALCATAAVVPASAQRGTVAPPSMGDGAFRDGEPILSREIYHTRTQFVISEQEVLIEKLHRRVSVRMSGVSIRDAAEFLSRATDLRVHVDGAVVTDRRITIEAEYVPVGVIAEEVAVQTGLLIAPETAGIGFRQVPFLDARGRHGVFRGPLTPWNDDWWRRPIGTHLMDSKALIAPIEVPGSDVVRIQVYAPVSSPP